MFVFNNCELNKLEYIENNLQKSITNIIFKYGKHMVIGDVDIAELFESAQGSRDHDICFVSESLKNIARSLRSKTELLKAKKIYEIKDFEKFKIEMVDIQENIMNLKKNSKSELSKLKLLENDLDDELNLFYNGKVAEWNESLHISNYDFVPSRIKNKSSGQCKEVQQFFDFVHQSGGHENGWRKEDHLLFIKMRTKYKILDELAFQIHEMFPDISIDEIKLHEEWFKKYLDLQSKKKDAINKWKHNKNNDKLLTQESSKTENIRSKNTKEDSKKIREKLIQWKIDREEKLMLDKEIKKQIAMDKIEKERMRRQEQIEMKKIVNEWKESKILYEQSERQHQRIYEIMEKKKRAANANKLIKQFQSMDELHILKMRQLHKKTLKEPKKRVQSGPSVMRDPKRLMKPTVQWAQRVRATKEPINGIIPIFAMPKLGIPEWRKSIA